VSLSRLDRPTVGSPVAAPTADAQAARPALGRRLGSLAGRAAVALILLFLALPAIVVAIGAFNEQALLVFPPRGFSLHWFANALTYPDFQRGFANSLIVTAWASCIALVVGATFAFAMDRADFPGKGLLEATLLSSLVIPHFTIGLGMLILAARVDMSRGFAVVVATHVVLVLPFVLRAVYVSVRNLDRRLELAAASLGASPVRVLLLIDLPLLAPGLFGGWLFAAILSFNEFTASLFVTGRRTQTVPVAMYNYVREYVDPTMAALSTLFIVMTALTLVLANRLLRLDRVLAIEPTR
jgi:putative spermidine/putrescine transport system permease protein